MKQILIVGASGVIGSAVVAEFCGQPDCKVYALSRRRSDLDEGLAYTHIVVDLMEPAACSRAVSEIGPITHMVYAAVAESPGLVAGWRDKQLMQQNLAMLRNILEPVAAAGQLRHVSLMQGTKAYGAHLHLVDIPARESEPRDQHENFYWLQEDLIRDRAAQQGWDWTIFRPQIVLGGAVGVVMNPLPVIGILAALAHEEGSGFGFPGRHCNIQEAVDARLIAQACVWAADAKAAHREIFNITNGDVWVLKHMWPAIAAMTGLEAAADRPVNIAAVLQAKQPVWDRIVARHGLRPTTLGELLGESHHYLDLLLGNAIETAPQPVLLSTIKLRQAGFAGCMDSLETMRYWLASLIKRKILPPMGAL